MPSESKAEQLRSKIGVLSNSVEERFFWLAQDLEHEIAALEKRNADLVYVLMDLWPEIEKKYAPAMLFTIRDFIFRGDYSMKFTKVVLPLTPGQAAKAVELFTEGMPALTDEERQLYIEACSAWQLCIQEACR